MKVQLIASRLEEINEGLLLQSGGIVEANFRKSKRLGAAARIANLLKGQVVIDNYNYLCAAAGELGINADTLEGSLSELQEIGYVRIYKTNGDISKVEETIPLLEEQYTAIGEKWKASNPSEIEIKSLEIIDDLMLAPQKEYKLISKHGIDEKTFHIIKDVGTSGNFYRSYTSPADGSTIGYSPLYHDENPEKVIDLIERYPDHDVTKKFRSIREYQGKPVDLIKDNILIEAINLGIIPTPSVTSTGGKRYFAFTPLQGVGKLEKSLLDKARAILSCVRYGEHFAGITTIRSALDILNALKFRKRIGSHSEIKEQYLLLHKLGVGKITKDLINSSRYFFHIIDTNDNIRALELAIQYLQLTEVIKTDQSTTQAKQLLLPGVAGSYGSPTRTRKEAIQYTTMSKDSVDALNHLIIGGSSGI